MKKFVALLIAGVMIIGCTACGNSSSDNGGADKESSSTNAENSNMSVEIKDANDVLTKLWEKYTEIAPEEQKFMIFGGDSENLVDGAPGKYDLSKAEDLEVQYCISSDAIALVDDAAAMMNAMNANIFSSAAYHVKDKENLQTVVDEIKERTLNNQWMCGFPETLIIVTVGDDYVVSAFGNAQAIGNVKAAFAAIYDSAAVVAVEESLAE